MAILEQGFHNWEWSSASGTIHDLQYRLTTEWIADHIGIRKNSCSGLRQQICHHRRTVRDSAAAMIVECHHSVRRLPHASSTNSCHNSSKALSRVEVIFCHLQTTNAGILQSSCRYVDVSGILLEAHVADVAEAFFSLTIVEWVHCGSSAFG